MFMPPAEQRLSDCVPGLIVLALFYGIYFAKTLAQKKRGIKTRQIGSRKEREIHRVETLMSIATLCAPASHLISIFLDWSLLPSGARFTGFCLGMAGDLIFLISVLKMKDSWRAGIPEKDKTELVTDGIYKFSRNPAFLGFDFMYIGMMLMFFNPLTVVFSLFATVTLHMQILQEESFLEKTFKEPYSEYKATVFRYLGRKKSGRSK